MDINAEFAFQIDCICGYPIEGAYSVYDHRITMYNVYIFKDLDLEYSYIVSLLYFHF